MTTYQKNPHPSLVVLSDQVKVAEDALRRTLQNLGWQMLMRESHDASATQVNGTVLASRWNDINDRIEFVRWRWLWQPNKVDFSLGLYTYEITRAAKSWGER